MKVQLFRSCPAVFLMLLACKPGLAQGPKAAADVHQGGRAEATYHGGLVTPPLPKPRFILTDTSGARFDFRSRTDGYVTLLFFGYTNCPDVCPTHMAYLGAAFKSLPKDVAARFKVVFVTTDPDRDNPRALRAWLNQFGKDFVGLTGSLAEIQAAQQAANLPVAKGAPSYDHSAFVLAYTSDNLGHVIYPSGISEADWLRDLPQLAKETWTGR
jgi:protein SCO1